MNLGSMFRVGFGYDVHQLVPDRELWLGGVKIPSDLGALGHSDADVLIHAICDALLGAAAMKDIGFHFPNNDPAYKGIDSKKLLHKTCELLAGKGYAIGNVDATLILQAPKIMPYVEQMVGTLAEIMRIEHDAVSIKATTPEHMGFNGRREGLEAHAVVLIYKTT